MPVQGTATTATRRQGESDGQYVQRRKDEIRANMAQGLRTQLFTDDDTRQLDHLALQDVMNINIVDNNPRLQQLYASMDIGRPPKLPPKAPPRLHRGEYRPPVKQEGGNVKKTYFTNCVVNADGSPIPLDWKPETRRIKRCFR